MENKGIVVVNVVSETSIRPFLSFLRNLDKLVGVLPIKTKMLCHIFALLR